MWGASCSLNGCRFSPCLAALLPCPACARCDDKPVVSLIRGSTITRRAGSILADSRPHRRVSGLAMGQIPLFPTTILAVDVLSKRDRYPLPSGTRREEVQGKYPTAMEFKQTSQLRTSSRINILELDGAR